MNIALLTPTRERVDWFRRMSESAIHTADEPDKVALVVKLDTDDFANHEEYKAILRPDQDIYQIGPSKCLSVLWNNCYEVIKPWADLCLHNGDDVIFRTQGWDTQVREAAKKFPKGIGMVFADDGLQHEGLATHGFYSTQWTEILGYFVPPYFAHDFNDAWLNQLGKWMRQAGFPNACIYLKDVLIEHMHHTAGKSHIDSVYKLAHTRRNIQDCGIIWKQKQQELLADKEKLLKVLQS